jgi:AcrR family transcriptional regulator
LFYRRGYTRVGVSEIAEAVGIAPSALYRHFAGKQQLLTRVVLDQLEPFEKVLADTGVGDLDAVVRELVGVALDNRQLGVLWQRESRHLPDAERATLREQLRSVATRLAVLARAYRSDLSDEDARFRAWCLFSAVTSPSYHKLEMPRGRFEELLGDAVVAVAAQPPLVFSRAGGGAASEVSSPVEHRASSRRRLLLSAATRLFAERGYTAVTTEDIGAAVGIAGPSVYKHFASKQDLLNSVVSRGASWLEIDLERVLSRSSGARDALGSLLRSYVTFALDHRGFIDILVGEVNHLPDEDRHRARQVQHEYVSEWVALLREVRPELDPVSARVLVQAALTVANDMARTGSARHADAVVGVGEALMLTTRAPQR